MVVLHYTAMPTCNDARARLCDPQTEVSAHYLISEHGEVLALVPEELRAWHAGAGAWGAVSDVNSRSIGIELANSGAAPFPERQMAALEAVLADVMHRWHIPEQRVIGHSDMAPGRKGDPGARFDWRRLALAGMAVWPDALTDEPGADSFQDAARQFGYPDGPIDQILAAFRLRFRPWAKGPLDAVDSAMARNLACRFPVDAAPRGA
ncbi:MAG: N-acetylmuramoyl-L-alanine amidase [Paracoccaceae bacterium]